MTGYLLTQNKICEDCDHLGFYLREEEAEKERFRLQKIYDDELAGKGYPQLGGNYKTIYFIEEIKIIE